jgi:hypothetical protein
MNSPLMIFITHSMIISGMVYWCLLMFIDVYWCLLGLPDYTPSHPKFFLHSWLITALKWLRTCPSRYTPLFLDNPKGTLGMMWAKCARLPNFVNLNNWWYLVQHIFFIGMLRVRQEGGPPKLESASVSTWSVQSIRVRKEILPDAHCPVWAVLITMVNISKKSWYWIATGHGWL